MSVTLALVLDDEIVAYFGGLAVDQGRTASEVVALLVADEARRAQGIDAELLARFDLHRAAIDPQTQESQPPVDRSAHPHRVSA